MAPRKRTRDRRPWFGWAVSKTCALAQFAHAVRGTETESLWTQVVVQIVGAALGEVVSSVCGALQACVPDGRVAQRMARVCLGPVTASVISTVVCLLLLQAAQLAVPGPIDVLTDLLEDVSWQYLQRCVSWVAGEQFDIRIPRAHHIGRRQGPGWTPPHAHSFAAPVHTDPANLQAGALQTEQVQIPRAPGSRTNVGLPGPQGATLSPIPCGSARVSSCE